LPGKKCIEIKAYYNFLSTSTMAKGMRSKIKKRWRKLRKTHIDNVVCKEQHNKIV
jgi:hypothetical protein